MASSNVTVTKAKLTLPLDYQQEIFHELQENDELVILGRGLGLLRIVSNFLHTYDVAGNNLVIVAGASERDQMWLEEALIHHAELSKSTTAKGLRIINSDLVTVGQRQKLYRQGGIFSITSRILISDLLAENMLPPENITGIVLLHAERTNARSQEAFCLRLFREGNKTGFIKAFSEDPMPFARGYNQLAKSMRDLFLHRSSIWPRFHLSVKNSLESKRPEVVEIEVKMSDNMKDIQIAILECIEATMRELRAANRDALDMEEWSLDEALNGTFDEMINAKLNPVSHTLSWKSRNLKADLTTLREMLENLIDYDAVTFKSFIDNIVDANKPLPGLSRQDGAAWLLLDAAETIISLSKRRAFNGDYRVDDIEEGLLPDGITPTLEEQPKWQILSDLLDEIEREQFKNPQPKGQSNNTVLIMCKSQSVARQLKEYLRFVNSDIYKTPYGARKKNWGGSAGRKMLSDKLYDYFPMRKHRSYFWKSFYADMLKAHAQYGPMNKQEESGRSSYGNHKAPPTKRRRVRGGAAAASAPARKATTVDLTRDTSTAEVVEIFEARKATGGTSTNPIDLEKMMESFELLEMDDLVVVHAFDKDEDERLLEELKPRYIILYEPDTAFIRRVEVYRSSHNQRDLKLYFMYYHDSVEEKKFLNFTRKEKDAFSKLIREKGNMAMTLTAPAQIDPDEAMLRVINTRIAGGGRLSATSDRPSVIVDLREFRSHLPALLHTKFKIIPTTLTVGDYVLSPQICVERKAINDLQQSLNSGRLYTQCKHMFENYERPMLLIEMQGGNPSLDPNADMESRSGPELYQTKLVLLTLAFKSLQIIWSTSPSHTAEIFAMLKTGQADPDAAKATSLGMGGVGYGEKLYNHTPMEMLSTVPGVEGDERFKLARTFENIRDVAGATEQELAAELGVKRGKDAWKFFNTRHLRDFSY